MSKQIRKHDKGYNEEILFTEAVKILKIEKVGKTNRTR